MYQHRKYSKHYQEGDQHFRDQQKVLLLFVPDDFK
jgi:hypothetical protein